MRLAAKRLWNDSVWSKVIAGVIITVAPLLWSSLRNQVAQYALALWNWIVVVVSLYRWQVMAWVLFGYGIGVISSYTRAFKHVRQATNRVIKEVALTTLSKQADQPHTSNVAIVEDQPKPVAKEFRPSDRQAQLLWAMMHKYPNDIDLRDAQANLGALTPAHAEKEMEQLASANVISIRRVSENAVYYRITIPGRDFLTTWLDEIGMDSDDHKP